MQKVKMMKKYADLIAEVCIQASQFQDVSITADVEMYPFVRYLISELYKYKVRCVDVNYYDRLTMRQFLLNTPDSRLNVLALRNVPKIAEEAKHHVAKIFLVGEDYAMLERIPMNRFHLYVNKRIQAEAEAFKVYRDLSLTFTMVCVPTNSWAKDLFPNMTPTQGMDLLWKGIYSFTNVKDDNNQINDNQAHLAHLNHLTEILNSPSPRLKALRLTSEKIDLTCDVPVKYIWQNGRFKDSYTHRDFLRTLPCEQVYTALYSYGTNGIVYASSPFYYQSNLIEGAWLKFKQGKIDQFGATKGQELLKEAFSTDLYANRIAKIGIVEKKEDMDYSPYKFNMIWNENKSTHLIIGRSPAECLENGTTMNSTELISHGMNQSELTLFFPIDFEDLKIVGLFDNNTDRTLFEKRKWVI